MQDLTDLWTSFTWSLLNGLNSPRIIIPTFLSVIFLALVTGSSRRVSLLGKTAIFLMGSYLILTMPFTASLLIRGLTLSIPIDSGKSADAIVVLTRGDELGTSRYDLAIQLWKERRAPKIFLTTRGRVGYMTNRFREEKLPRRVLDGTVCARTTYEEAVSSFSILWPKGVQKIFLITDPLHILRSSLTFQAQGFMVFPKVALLPTELSALQRSLLALREYLGLVSYAILGRFQMQEPHDLARFSHGDLTPSSCLIEWLRNS